MEKISTTDLERIYPSHISREIAVHFSNNLERFSAPPERIQNYARVLNQLEKKDNILHALICDKEHKEFLRSSSWMDRLLKRRLFIPPEQEFSLETKTYQAIVHVGTTLNEYLGNLKKFSDLFLGILGEYNNIYNERETLAAQTKELELRIGGYAADRESSNYLLNRLENFDLVDDEKEELSEKLGKEYQIDITNPEIREHLRGEIIKGMFLSEQLKLNDSSDFDIAQTRLSSLDKRMISLKKDAETIWKIYHPARKKAAVLKATYEELESCITRKIVISSVTSVLTDAESLCEEARIIQDELDIKIDTDLEILMDKEEAERVYTGLLER